MYQKQCCLRNSKTSRKKCFQATLYLAMQYKMYPTGKGEFLSISVAEEEIQIWTTHLTTPELPQPLLLVGTETFALRDLEFDSLSSTLIHVSWIWCIMLTDFISWVQMISVVKAHFILKPMYDFDAGPVQSISPHKYFSFYEQRFECNYI